VSDLNNKHLPSDIDSLTRKDLVEIYHIHVEEMQTAQKRIVELEEEKLNMQISLTHVRESIGRISAFIENIEPSSHEAVIAFNRCMDICAVIDEMDLPEFEGGAE
jgi:wobble nucleotide-excising tRNase